MSGFPWAVVAAIAGSILTALLSLRFARRLEEARTHAQLQHAAYIDLLKALVLGEYASREAVSLITAPGTRPSPAATQAGASAGTPALDAERKTAVMQAVLRIGLYGTPDVVRLTTDLIHTKVDGDAALFELYAAMRSDRLEGIAKEDLRRLLYGKVDGEEKPKLAK